MPHRLFRYYQRSRLLNTNVNVIAAGLLAMAIVKGLIAVLMVLYDRKAPREILETDAEAVLDRLDLGSHISPNRRNGFYAMVETIKKTAAAAAAQQA